MQFSLGERNFSYITLRVCRCSRKTTNARTHIHTHTWRLRALRAMRGDDKTFASESAKIVRCVLYLFSTRLLKPTITKRWFGFLVETSFPSRPNDSTFLFKIEFLPISCTQQSACIHSCIQACIALCVNLNLYMHTYDIACMCMFAPLFDFHRRYRPTEQT